MYDVVVKKFTFAVSSRDELLVIILARNSVCLSDCYSSLVVMLPPIFGIIAFLTCITQLPG